MKKDYVLRKQQREIRQLFNRMRGGKFETFEEMIDQFRSTLRHDDVIITDDLAGNLQWCAKCDYMCVGGMWGVLGGR